MFIIDFERIISQPFQCPICPSFLFQECITIIISINTIFMCLELILRLFLVMSLATKLYFCIQIFQNVQFQVQIDCGIFLFCTILLLCQIFDRIKGITITFECIHLIHTERRIQLNSLLERSIIRIIFVSYTIREITAYFQQPLQSRMLKVST